MAQEDPETLEIASVWVLKSEVPDPGVGWNGWYTNLYGLTETLFILDDHQVLTPHLAQKARNLSPTTWEVTLKEGIRFQDGSSLTATAVKYSFDRIVDPDSPSFNKRLATLLDLATITVNDPRRLVFTTREPNAAFLYDLTSPGTGIISTASGPKKFYGTGPFQLESVTAKEEVRLKRFDDYWQGRPKLKKVHITAIPDSSARMLAFESGRVDLATNFPENDALRLEKDDARQILARPTNRLCFFMVRVADGPLADPKIRRAINLAIDRQEIVSVVLAGIGGKVGASLFPEALPWHNADLAPVPHDPEKAKALLKRAGAVDTDGDGVVELDGRPLILNIWTYEGRPALKPTIELVQSQLARVGVGARLRVTKSGSPINAAMQKGEVHLNLQMWNAAPQGDPAHISGHIFKTGSEMNVMGYSNPRLDALIDKGKTTFEPEARKKIYDEVQALLYADCPVMVLFHKSSVAAAKNTVSGFRLHPAEVYALDHRVAKQ
jgi:peptide/nickel transport system substrate-binding protein